MAVKILIDSASDINKQEAKSLGIEMISMEITFNKDIYYDGDDLLPNEFYEKLVEGTILPKTSQITPYRFEERFKEMTKNGDKVIVITISSKLSNTYNCAVKASLNYPEKVYVIDSLNACCGERILCLHALNLINQGKEIEEIVDELNNIKSKIRVVALVDTLEYLKKGGRISSAVAFAGEIFSIKPLIGVVDGEVKMLGKARGTKRANALLTSLIIENGEVDISLPFAGIYSGLNDTNIKNFINDNSSLWQGFNNNVPIHIIGSTIGTHVGPGAVGLVYFSKK